MSNRFSKHRLFDIRNRIDIDSLIQHPLKLPIKHCEGHLRFLCPICSEFNTATNPRTNLARYFRCNRNFNTIDRVMTVRNADFKETVTFLSALLPWKIFASIGPSSSHYPQWPKEVIYCETFQVK